MFVRQSLQQALLADLCSLKISSDNNYIEPDEGWYFGVKHEGKIISAN